MDYSEIAHAVGISFVPLSDDGNVARLVSPFRFEDGEAAPIMFERTGNMIRFFDDGEILQHLRGRGLRLNDHRNVRSLKHIVEAEGVNLTQLGEIEIWSPVNEAPAAFAKYVAGLMAILAWERNQSEGSTDAALLIEEVALYLRSWKPSAEITESPEYRGVSGSIYKLDFRVDHDGVIVTPPHPASVNAVAKKLLDIRASTENNALRLIVVLDDRRDAEAARREGSILESVANVMMISRFAAATKGRTQ